MIRSSTALISTESSWLSLIMKHCHSLTIRFTSAQILDFGMNQYCTCMICAYVNFKRKSLVDSLYSSSLTDHQGHCNGYKCAQGCPMIWCLIPISMDQSLQDRAYQSSISIIHHVVLMQDCFTSFRSHRNLRQCESNRHARNEWQCFNIYWSMTTS